jgi:hypothetical protein
MNIERDWWFQQDQDDAWVQYLTEEAERRALEFFGRDPVQLQLPLEDTRSQHEIEQEYDTFMQETAR